MSTSEPFMPAHWSRPVDRAAEIDADHDVDVFEPSPADDAEPTPTFPDNPAFRTPTPGDALSETALESDLGND